MSTSVLQLQFRLLAYDLMDSFARQPQHSTQPSPQPLITTYLHMPKTPTRTPITPMERQEGYKVSLLLESAKRERRLQAKRDSAKRFRDVIAEPASHSLLAKLSDDILMGDTPFFQYHEERLAQMSDNMLNNHTVFYLSLYSQTIQNELFKLSRRLALAKIGGNNAVCSRPSCTS